MSRIIRIPQVDKPSRYDHPTPKNFFVVDDNNTAFFDAALTTEATLHFTSRRRIAKVDERGNDAYNRVMYPFYTAPTASLMLQTLHGAFCGHRAISLRPDTMWYMIVHEVAIHAKKHSKRYGAILGNAAGEKTVLQISNFRLHDPNDTARWNKTIGDLLSKYLLAAVGNDVRLLFMPNFSTTTPEDQIGMVVALADVASPHYNITIGSKCHIPEVRLEGTTEDWQLIVDRTKELSRIFPTLRDYLMGLSPILRAIVDSMTAHEPSMVFWRSIYKYDGSSDNPWVSGWITAFLAHTQTAQGVIAREHFGLTEMGISEFPSHISTVPFIWDRGGSQSHRLVLLGGITGVDFDDNKYLTPRLGFAVAEVYPS